MSSKKNRKYGSLIDSWKKIMSKDLILINQFTCILIDSQTVKLRNIIIHPSKFITEFFNNIAC